MLAEAKCSIFNYGGKQWLSSRENIRLHHTHSVEICKKHSFNSSYKQLFKMSVSSREDWKAIWGDENVFSQRVAWAECSVQGCIGKMKRKVVWDEKLHRVFCVLGYSGVPWPLPKRYQWRHCSYDNKTQLYSALQMWYFEKQWPS